jgi:hypothetical protein
VQRRFERAWTRADITLTSSRIMNDDLSRRSVVDAKADRDDWNVDAADRRPPELCRARRSARHAGESCCTATPTRAASYDRILPLLPPSFHVFAVTHRGHGDSGKPDTGYTPSHFAGRTSPRSRHDADRVGGDRLATRWDPPWRSGSRSTIRRHTRARARRGVFSVAAQRGDT